jgi:small subunit ribosomal protein S2
MKQLRGRCSLWSSEPEDGTPKWHHTSLRSENGIYIIDLQKTVKKIEEAYEFMRSVAESGRRFFFVGTKKQATSAILDEARRSACSLVNERWLGGMLTNYKTIVAETIG